MSRTGLVQCSNCKRHIKQAERNCPFCATRVKAAPAMRVAMGVAFGASLCLACASDAEGGAEPGDASFAGSDAEQPHDDTASGGGSPGAGGTSDTLEDPGTAGVYAGVPGALEVGVGGTPEAPEDPGTAGVYAGVPGVLDAGAGGTPNTPQDPGTAGVYAGVPGALDAGAGGTPNTPQDPGSAGVYAGVPGVLDAGAGGTPDAEEDPGSAGVYAGVPRG